MKIKLFSNYDRSEDLLERFMANYEVYDRALSFTIGNEYDYAVVFNRTDEPILRSSKIITVIQEPSWSPIHYNNPFLLNSDYLIIHDARRFEEVHQIRLGKTVFETPAYMFYHDHIHRTFFMATEDFKKEKKLSIIMSGLNWNIGNYHKRLRLLEKILESDLDIDIYGRGLQISDDRYKGEVKYKYSALMPYEYSIAIENTNEKNYITEKFVDCVLCNTTPIYCGAPNIAEVYNEKFFKTLDLDNEDPISAIKSIIQHPAPQPDADSNKSRYFKQRNLYRMIKEIVAQLN